MNAPVAADATRLATRLVITMKQDSHHDAMALAGTLLGGKYRLDRLLGAGGMGAVYAAENTSLRAPVAIKVLHAAVLQRPELRDRFAQEAQAAAQVRHANIVSVLDFGYDEEAELFYIVQELLAGSDLKRRIREGGAMSSQEAIALLMPVMRALAFAHSKGVVHRDLKPDNIFLCETPDGVVPKLIDFGIAKVVDDQGQSIQNTSTHMALGTPHYMSPEQARGERALDHRTDVWSLGVVLYFTLTGQLPYSGATANVVLAAIITRPPTRIEEHLPAIAPDVAALVHGALAYDPEHRFPTMEAFWQAARACSAVSAQGVTTAPAASTAPATARAPSVQVPGSGQVPTFSGLTGAPQIVSVATARPRNSATWLALAALLLFPAAGGLAYLGTRLHPRTARTAATATAPTPASPVVSEAPTRTPPTATQPPATEPAAPQPSAALPDAGAAPQAPAARAKPPRSRQRPDRQRTRAPHTPRSAEPDYVY